VRQAERLHLLPHTSDYNLVQQKVGRGVVAQDAHQHGRVADSERHPGMHVLQHSGSRHLVDLEQRQRIIERDHRFLGQIVQRDEDGDLDQARRRESLVPSHRQALARVEVIDGVAEHPVKVMRERVEGAVKRNGIRALPTRCAGDDEHQQQRDETRYASGREKHVQGSRGWSVEGGLTVRHSHPQSTTLSLYPLPNTPYPSTHGPLRTPIAGRENVVDHRHDAS